MSYQLKRTGRAIWRTVSYQDVLKELGSVTRRRGIRRVEYVEQLNNGRWVITPTATIRRAT